MAAPAHVPPVTMEDLHAFQARHFTGASNITVRHYENGDYGDDGDDDGLGYYPDGVKRTLTDQQIEIFRHSEIQSLSRERKLKEQARLEEMGEDIQDDAENSDFGAEDGKAPLAQEDGATDKVEEKPIPSESKNGRGEYSEGKRVASSGKKKKQHAGPETPSITTLDYGDDTSASAKPDALPAQHHASLMGRKMVSYGDDDAGT